MACLQTFPERYEFGTKEDGSPLGITEARLQVGNAVPPAVAKAVLSEVKNSLLESDRKRALERQASAERQRATTITEAQKKAKDVIELD